MNKPLFAGRQAIGLTLISLLIVTASAVAQGYDANALKRDIDQQTAALAEANGGDAKRLAARELDRSREWLEQAERSWKRRAVGLGQMQLRNSQMDLKLANAIAMSDQMTRRNKQLQGEVDALERTVQSALSGGTQ